MTETTTLIAHALVAEKFGQHAMLVMRKSFRANGVTNANARDIVTAVMVDRGIAHPGGERLRAIWGCV